MKGFNVVKPFTLHWGEMDAMAHVNNTRYLVWFETGRIEYFRRIGLGTHSPLKVGPILAHIDCDFLKPLTYPAELVVGVRAVKLGRTSLVVEHAVALAEHPDDPCARGQGVIVLIDYLSGEKVPIPDDLRETILSVDPSTAT